MSWKDAAGHCLLASIQSEEEEAIAVNLTRRYGEHVWLGGKFYDDWTWTNGENFEKDGEYIKV